MSPSKHQNRRRKDSSREPPTIDLKATVVDEGRAATTDAAGAPVTAPAEAPSAGEGAIPAAPVEPAATAGEGSPSPAGSPDADTPPVEVRTPFVTAIDPAPADEAHASSGPSGGTQANAPESSAVGTAGDAPPAGDNSGPASSTLAGTSPGSDLSDSAGSSGATTSFTGPERAGTDTRPDSTAVADEGPALDSNGTAAGEDRSVSAESNRDAVDPTVPVADEDLGRSRGSVPPVGGPGSAPPPERRSAGFGSLAGAGLLGGLIGAGLLYGLQTWRSSQAPDDPRIAQIEQRLGALPRADALQGLDRRIAALESAQTQLGQRVGTAQSLAERAAARAEEAANRPAPAAPGAPAPDRPAPPAAEPGPAAPSAPPAPTAGPDLANRLAALEDQVRNPAAATELANRLGALETQLRERTEASTGADQALERRLGETRQALEGRVAETSQGLERRLTEATQRLEARIGETSQALEQRVAASDQRIEALGRQLAEWNPDAIRAGLRVVLADRLNDALNQGAPFADVLGSLRGFAVAPERLQALEPLAASGAPTVAALRQDFGPLSERIERTARGEAEGVVDRLLRMTDKVVSVRSLGDPNSNAVPDLLARIENALDRGALRDAAAAWDALPEASRRVGEDWGRRLKARVAAEEAARGIASDAIAALNAQGRR